MGEEFALRYHLLDPANVGAGQHAKAVVVDGAGFRDDEEPEVQKAVEDVGDGAAVAVLDGDDAVSEGRLGAGGEVLWTGCEAVACVGDGGGGGGRTALSNREQRRRRRRMW
jgi:hypothetical protein